MKKSILLAVLLSLVVSSCTYEQKERQNWKELFGARMAVDYFDLNGDVQHVTVFDNCSYKNFLDEESYPDGSIAAYVSFDEYGDVVESEMKYYCNSGDEDFDIGKYVYNQQRKLLLVRGYNTNLYCEYDGLGRLVSKRLVFDAGYTYTYSYDYDSQGNMVEERSYDADGKLFSRVCWTYNGKGRVLEQIRYDDGRCSEHKSYRYNLLGRLVEEKNGDVVFRKYDWRGRVKSSENCKCKYDKYGNIIAKAVFGYDTVVYRYKIVYR